MRPRALVVDGSLTVRMDLRSALANAGFLVMACSTKAVAWATLQNGGIKLVLLDIHLPDLTGFELATQLAALDPRPIVILISSRDATSYGSDLIGAPVRGFIAKWELNGETLGAMV